MIKKKKIKKALTFLSLKLDTSCLQITFLAMQSVPFICTIDKYISFEYTPVCYSTFHKHDLPALGLSRCLSGWHANARILYSFRICSV